VILDLPFTGPFAADAAFAGLVAHAVPGLESVDPTRRAITRLVPAPHGPALVTVTLAPHQVSAEIDPGDPADAAPIVERLRRWLDLDADPASAETAWEHDPVLGPLVTARPGLRVVGSLDGYVTTTLTVIGQQVSLAAARTFAGRLVARYGGEGRDGHRTFPEPSVLAAVPATELQAAVGLTGPRTRTVLALAAAVAGGLRIEATENHDAVRGALLEVPGIGPWTVDYVTVRVLGDRDAFVPGDLVLRRSLGVTTSREALARAEDWRPWRALALVHLWTAAAYPGA
jgi:3-methyladenine DNA glycosylase/8-oxoguanine DNA glycosylase